MKINTFHITKSVKILLAIFLSLTIQSIDKAYAQKRIIIGVKYIPSMSFSSFADNQYVSHAWDLNTVIMTKWGLGSEFPFIRIDNIRISKKIDMGFEVGSGLIGMGYRRTITGNYTGGKKWSNILTGSSSCSFRCYPINFYFFTKPSKNNYRKYLKIGGIIINNKDAFTTIGITNFIYPDANSSLQDTISETSISIIKPFTKLTINLGIGIEKILWQRIFIDLGLVYNQGFSIIRTSDVEYTIDGITFNNRILNKGSYLGIELGLGINPFYKRKETKPVHNSRP